MATGIVKRHSKGCPGRDGGRCRCKAGWEASVYLARESRKVRKTFHREAEARSWRADALAAANRGTLRATRRDTRTLVQALAEFIDGMKTGTVRPKGRTGYKPATIRSYEQQLHKYIEPADLAAMKVGEVRRSDVQAFVDEPLAAGLAPSTVSNALNPIQAVYRRGIDRDELAYNPAVRIDLPGQGDGRPKRIASAAEALDLLAALLEEDRALWATAFYAGLRRGELQALRRCDVDLGASLIRVERGWDQEEGAQAPKSAASRRTIPLLAILRDYLDHHLVRAGEREPETLVFGRTATGSFAPMAVGKRAKKAWREANERERQEAEREGRRPTLLEPITLHECRHTFASLLIDAGANAKAIQTFMGHSKIQTTFDTYGHLMPGSHDEVRERMDAYLADAAAPAIELAEVHE
jgi:integrase